MTVHVNGQKYKTELFAEMFPDSKIAKDFSCAKTKTRYPFSVSNHNLIIFLSNRNKLERKENIGKYGHTT